MSVSNIRTRILVPVWGPRYVELFCSAGLPSLLSEGNLPVFARRTDCEVIFLTTASSIASFKLYNAYNRLCEICPTSFVEIDDIVNLDNYGVTLTLAYARGIQSLGSRQIGTYYIFLNADFVLSKDGLSALLNYIHRGCGVVLAASLRCNEEEVRPLLPRLADPDDDRLSVPSRRLVDIVLQNLHPTALASTVNQPAFHHAAANQFLWRVDQHTLIGRYYLLFMLCIRVDRMMEAPSGFCDYTFAPDLCPSGTWATITDSDELFIAELQAARGESNYIRFGKIPPADYAARLSVWSTREHRANADQTLVFHAASLPATTGTVCQAADAFMTEIKAALHPAPVSHRVHPYWMSALQVIQVRFGRLPAELESASSPVPRRHPRWATRLAKILYRSPLYPQWNENRLFRALVERTPASPSERGLYVSNREPRGCRSPESRASIVRHTGPDGVMNGGLLPPERFDFCLIYLAGDGLDKLGPTLGALASHVSAHAPIYCFLDGVQFTRTGMDFAADIALAIPYGVAIRNFRTSGNWTRSNLARAVAYWILEYKDSIGVKRFGPALHIVWLVAKIAAANLIAAAFPSHDQRQYRSCIAFECTFDFASAEAALTDPEIARA